MTALILALPSETSQQEADRMLRAWQVQRAAGIKPERRKLPADDAFSRDISVIQAALERKR